MAGKLRTIAPLIRSIDTRTVKLPPKQVDPLYLSQQYREWREAVVSRAGRRCEVVENGKRCWKAEPKFRMYADHIVEVRDGGSRFDLANGCCKCSSHHGRKTIDERVKRLRS